MSVAPIFIEGRWESSAGTQTFSAFDPAARQPLPELYPVSPWIEVERAIKAAHQAFLTVQTWPGERFAAFLDQAATNLEQRAEQLVETAHRETALPKEPRLKTAELPRTINQLRQAAASARSGSWALPTIDKANDIRSMFGPIGPVVVFGPNNFPYAYNAVAGGDFAAAVAAGNPVIAKGHPSHPTTTRLLATAMQDAARATGMPAGFVQLIYHMAPEDGMRLVSHPLMGAIGYTGSRTAGLALKQAADKAGKPIYLELSSINPVVLLPGALRERGEKLAEEFTGSCLMGAGQFCTNPGLVLIRAEQPEVAEQFVKQVAAKFAASPSGTLLGEGVLKNLQAGVAGLQQAGAILVTGGIPESDGRWAFKNTLLRVTGQEFLRNPLGLQTEAFGNCSLFVIVNSDEQLTQIIETLEGNLTASIYTDTAGSDDDQYNRIAPLLRQRAGRLLDDKMPTGVAVSAGMNHGGPYPATGHPGFSAVGFPGTIRRFAMLQCYDHIRPHRLPSALRDQT